jgi:eukaryotic-like serine/threonine-protein kinase
MIGHTLGHYRIRSKLGQGGMGEVFLAEDTRLKRDVALKTLSEVAGAQPDRLARFAREAEAIAALNHPNIVTIYSFEEEDGLPFLTMELVDGQTLDETLPRGGMPLGRLLEIAVTIADAVSSAHERGVIHRDLKPANVMLTREGRVKVLDFGLAKLAARDEPPGAAVTLTREGTLMGTLTYLSPEQLQGRPADARSDVFSIGIMLFELATGERPFVGQSGADVASAILRDPPPPLASRRAGLPRQLDRIVEHCLEKDPERRFQTVKDVRNELERLQEEIKTAASGDGSTAPTEVLTAPPTRRALSRPLAFAAIAGVALTAAVLFFGPRVLTPEPAPPEHAQEAAAISSLAVLPFENLSRDPEEEYFAQAMTDALIAELGDLPGIHVVPRITSRRYASSGKPLEQIARELGADVLIDGTVQQAQGKARIHIELLRSPQVRLWNSTYETEMSDVLALQSRIVREIAGQIRVNLAPLDDGSLGQQKLSVDPEALRQYLKGRYYADLLSQEAYERSITAFERAIAREPAWALPRAGLATTYAARLKAGLGDPDSDWKKTAASVAAALELDPSNQEALSLQGVALMFDRWDWVGAREQIEQALHANPKAVEVLQNYSSLLLVTGEVDAGIEAHRAALAAKPLSHDLSCSLVRKYNSAGAFEEAIKLGERTVEQFPTCPFEHLYIAEALIEKGQLDDAIVHLESSLAIAVTPRGLGRLGVALWLAGRKAEARETLARLEAIPRADGYHLAPLYVAMGDLDSAFAALERSWAQRSVWLPYLAIEPAFAAIRQEPRFLDLVRRIGLKPTSR